MRKHKPLRKYQGSRYQFDKRVKRRQPRELKWVSELGYTIERIQDAVIAIENSSEVSDEIVGLRHEVTVLREQARGVKQQVDTFEARMSRLEKILPVNVLRALNKAPKPHRGPVTTDKVNKRSRKKRK